MEGTTYAKLYANLVRSLLESGYEFEDEIESQIIPLLLDESIKYFQQNDLSEYIYFKFIDHIIKKLSSSEFELVEMLSSSDREQFNSKSDADYAIKREFGYVTFCAVRDDLITAIFKIMFIFSKKCYQIENVVSNNYALLTLPCC